MFILNYRLRMRPFDDPTKEKKKEIMNGKD